MTRRRAQVFALATLMCAHTLAGCAEGTLHRDDSPRTQDHPFPRLNLTSEATDAGGGGSHSDPEDAAVPLDAARLRDAAPPEDAAPSQDAALPTDAAPVSSGSDAAPTSDAGD
jgi:hypothetical protein